MQKGEEKGLIKQGMRDVRINEGCRNEGDKPGEGSQGQAGEGSQGQESIIRIYKYKKNSAEKLAEPK